LFSRLPEKLGFNLPGFARMAENIDTMTLENAKLPQPALQSTVVIVQPPRMARSLGEDAAGVDFVTNIMDPGSLVRVIVGQQRYYAPKTNVIGGMP
jgi:hypothetical protein